MYCVGERGKEEKGIENVFVVHTSSTGDQHMVEGSENLASFALAERPVVSLQINSVRLVCGSQLVADNRGVTT